MCGKDFSNQSGLTRHKNSKTPCILSNNWLGGNVMGSQINFGQVGSNFPGVQGSLSQTDSGQKYKKQKIPKAVRMALWNRDFLNSKQGKCYTCGRFVYDDDFQAGHIIPESKGGTMDLKNLRVLCKPCNTSCGTMNLDDFTRMVHSVMYSRANSGSVWNANPVPTPIKSFSNLYEGLADMDIRYESSMQQTSNATQNAPSIQRTATKDPSPMD